LLGYRQTYRYDGVIHGIKLKAPFLVGMIRGINLNYYKKIRLFLLFFVTSNLPTAIVLLSRNINGVCYFLLGVQAMRNSSAIGFYFLHKAMPLKFSVFLSIAGGLIKN
jgi:hypothetical protein